MADFLPVGMEEIKERGKKQADFVLVTGDAYVDHPSFGAAVIGRLLESRGYTVGVIAQPDWKNPKSFQVFGQPRLGFFVTGGNIDSMVGHYSVAKKPRDKDAYSPGGKTGLRPDRATIVYCNRIREIYKDSAIVIGGLEASLRRLAHYDYWDNKVRRSILLDSAADILVYGMGEGQSLEIAQALESGLPVSELTFIRGTVYKTKDLTRVYDCITLPSFAEVVGSKESFARSFLTQYQNTDQVRAKNLVEAYGSVYVVQNRPALALTQEEFDSVSQLPYKRDYHPMYENMGGVPAIEEVKFSIIGSRGCFGGCCFCALSFHQGKRVTGRSHESVLAEGEELTKYSDFKGYIHDVGGPTANFRGPACKKQLESGVCSDKSCLFPKPCKSLRVEHENYRLLLKKLEGLAGVKKVFVRSGIRYDYLMADTDEAFFTQLVDCHVSGRLKVAPEHIAPKVLERMGKPNREVYDRFVQRYGEINRRLGKKQFLVPYFMSSHPGSDLHAAIELAEYIRDSEIYPEQAQDFYPTPGTFSTCMYYTEIDPRTMEKVYVPKNPHEKAMQRALIQYRNPKNYDLVHEALIKAGRGDLIGFDKKCLIRPRPVAWASSAKSWCSDLARPAPGIGGKKTTVIADGGKGRKDRKEAKKRTIRNVHRKKK